MDALPVFEETDAPFKSAHEGFMHACGHDVHMTILIGLIERIVTSDLNRNFSLSFSSRLKKAEAVLRNAYQNWINMK